eukprot:7378973-Prymnesium_polylepis.2
MDNQLCASLTCKWRQKLREGKDLPPIVHNQAKDEGGGVGSTLLTVLLLLLFAGGYTMLYCWYRDIKVGRGDLRARRNRRGSWFKAKVF